MLLEEVFPKVVGLDASIGAVSAGVRPLTSVSHSVGLESSRLSEGFATLSTGMLRLRVYLHMLLKVVLGSSTIVTTIAVEILVLGMFDQNVLVMMTLH